MEAREVIDSITDFVDSVNRGDQAAALAHFTDDVTIVEDLAPFRWHGPNAGAEWMLAMWQNAQRNNVSAVVMEISAPTRIEVEDGAAYAVVPGLLTYERPGSALRAEGLLTFSLRESGQKWLISALTWSGPVAT
jgi:ketosteroid isomerase-like protein